MNYSKYFSMPNAPVPDEIELKIEKTGNITPLPFSCAGDILSSKSLQNEIGTIKLSDGSYLVAMTCPMPLLQKKWCSGGFGGILRKMKGISFGTRENILA